MSSIEAFPRSVAVTPTGNTTDGKAGMTLRDYFAAHAPFTMADAIESCQRTDNPNPTGSEVMEMLSAMSFLYAEVMLAERAK